MKRVTIEGETTEALIAGLLAAASKLRLAASDGNWRLDAMMRRRGVSGYGLAELLSVTPTCVYYWRAGKRRPQPYILPELCAALKCNQAEIGFP